MDVLYHWKDIGPDLKAGRVGWFRSNKDKLAEFEEGHPDFIWVVKTPGGSKGKLQLVARVLWTGRATGTVPAQAPHTAMYYDPDDRNSVWFEGAGQDTDVERLTRWAERHFPAAVGANFQGAHGQQSLRGAVSKELLAIAEHLRASPFRTMPQKAVPT